MICKKIVSKTARNCDFQVPRKKHATNPLQLLCKQKFIRKVVYDKLEVDCLGKNLTIASSV